MSRTATSLISELPLLPSDPIYGMQILFKNDPRPDKINLSIGVCRDEEQRTFFFKAVELAEAKLQEESPSYEYLPLTGLGTFCTHTKELVCKNRPSIIASQTVGGTGALYVAARLLAAAHMHTVFVPEPTWTNHKPLFTRAGHDVFGYQYYDKTQGAIAFSKLCDAIRKMPERSAIVIQASCHNPTGIDLLPSHFHTISQLIKERKIYPIFDLAYQGLGDGLDEDVKGIHIFLDEGHELMVATTFAKSFGLYNDRPGVLLIHTPDESHQRVVSHVQAIARSCYSSPPAHGAKIISMILADPRLKRLWEKELQEYRDRLNSLRRLLHTAMSRHTIRFHYDHLLHTKGLFCLFNISEAEVLRLRNEHGLYLSLDGRISLSAITKENVDRVAAAFATL